MARKNRISLPDAIYHVTTRIAHRAMLLAGDAIKDKVFRLIYDCAVFSGVEVLACCVMDNHLHIFLHVPKVPEEFWTVPGAEPSSYAFGMRPPECRDPMWPRPSQGTVPLPRPALGFMLDDDELLRRLAAIYGGKRAAAVVEGWHRLEKAGCADRADAHRERLCRRMYNISQYMKTLKESVTRIFNSPGGAFKHEGALWQGRFHSGVVEPRTAVLATVAAYIAYNPVKAGIADAPGSWRWSSFARALGDGPLSATCRGMYERMLGCAWEVARGRLEAMFEDGLPEGLSAEALREICNRHAREERDMELRAAIDGRGAVTGGTGPNGYGRAAGEEDKTEDAANTAEAGGSGGTGLETSRVRASQAIHVTLGVFLGAFIGSVGFARRMLRALPPGFPSHGVHSARLCSALAWVEPPRRAA